MKYSTRRLQSNPNERKLLIASYDGDIRQVRELLSRGVNSNIVNSDGQTPLILAVMSEQLEVVDLLLTSPGNEAKVNIGDNNGRTPLYWACFNHNLEIAKRLLAVPETNPNIADKYGYVPLFITFDEEINLEMFKVLLSAGANPDVLDNYSQPVEVVEILDNYLPSLHTLSIRSIRKNKINGKGVPTMLFSF